MDKLCKRILDYMIKASDTPTEKFYDYGGDTPASEEIAPAIHAKVEEVDSAIRYLLKNGYLNDHGYCFSLSYTGLKYKSFTWEERVDYWKRSILVPIIVAFLTSILTTDLWPSLKNWLLSLLG